MFTLAILIVSTLCLQIDGNGIDSMIRDENMLTEIENLSTEILNRIKPGHCYTIVTDPFYQDILGTKLFREIQRSAYFVVRVPFHEDALNPSNKTRRTLAEARKSGCKCYLIFFANGVQMERFMRFADRNRVIDTQANIILLHDYRLFVPRLFYLWKRFVNVIFIRQYEYAKHTNRTQKVTTYELATVPYPLPITKIFVTKNIDFWQNGRFRRGGKLILDKTKNMNGQPMRAVVLRHTPGVSFSTGESNETNFFGLEIEIIRSISVTVNFTVEFYETEDALSEQWGQKNADGTFSGLLGEIVDGDADIALGDLSYTLYHLDVMDLSVPYTSQCWTFLTPEALTDNSWQTLILPFSGGMWGGILFFLLCVGSVFFFLERIYQFIHGLKYSEQNTTKFRQFSVRIENVQRKNKTLRRKLTIVQRRNSQSRDIFYEFGNCILYTYSMLLFVSLPRLPRSWPIRLLTGWYWVYCILIAVAYRASLTAILANPAPRVTIDTLEELAESPIEVGVWGEQNKQFFNRSADKIGQQIGTKIEKISDSDEALRRVSRGKFAYYENEHYLREIRFKHEQDESNKYNYLHIMKDCAINMPISIGLEKNSPLRLRFNRVLRRVIESGLVGKWLKESVKSFESSVEEPPKEALMDLKKLYGAIIAIVIGFSIGFFILIGEIMYWKYVTKKSPLYDKYSLAKLYEKSSLNKN